jgi:hypothetical protein
VGFFHTSALPKLSTADSNTLDEEPMPPPTLRLHTLLSPHAFGVKESSCLQMTRDRIQMVYWALADADGAGFRTVQGVNVGLPPERVMEGFGVCVRGWGFGAG